MDYSQTLEWLYAQLPMYQRVGQSAYKADLNNTHQLMELLNHPEKKFRSIHIAGTNGKGSVSHMLAAVFQKAGYKTGLYTSPHLMDFRERIRINGEMIPQNDVISFVTNHKDSFSQIGLSFFEMTVGLAFEHFAINEVDIAIIETGMGGRLDSTNVIHPEMSIITNISKDHTGFLGTEISSIAREKAGIIKPGSPVLIGEKQNEAADVFLKTAKVTGSAIYFAEDLVKNHNHTSDLKGSYQNKNIRTVLAAIEILEDQDYNLKRFAEVALNNVKSITGFRGRWEVLGNEPLIITDTAHNEAGVKEVLQQISELPYRQLHLVWGMVGDKDVDGILKLLPNEAKYYFCRPNIPRGLDQNTLYQLAQGYQLKGDTFNSVSEALNAAKRSAAKDDLIFAGGSTFIVAEVLPEFAGRNT